MNRAGGCTRQDVRGTAPQAATELRDKRATRLRPQSAIYGRLAAVHRRMWIHLGMVLLLSMSLVACGSDTDVAVDAAPAAAADDEEAETVAAPPDGAVFTDTSSGTPAVPAEELQANEEYTFAVFVKNVVNPFWAAARAGADDAAERYGVTLRHFAPTEPDNVAEQTAILDDVIADGSVDAIIFAPVDFVAQTAQIERANERGIPVCNFSNKMDGGEIAYFVGSNDVEIGSGVLDWVAEQLDGEGRIIIIEGVPGAVTAQNRQRGIEAALENHPGLELVASQTANYARTEASDVVENLLTQHSDIDAIIAHNDEMALGASAAVQSVAGYDLDDIIITGVDGTPDALQAITDGRIDASADYGGYPMGFNATEACVRYLNGEHLENPELVLPFSMIDHSNLDTYYERARESGLID
jgi:ribose transport system substrate-binding protein